jgi:hypothetical protein
MDRALECHGPVPRSLQQNSLPRLRIRPKSPPLRLTLLTSVCLTAHFSETCPKKKSTQSLAQIKSKKEKRDKQHPRTTRKRIPPWLASPESERKPRPEKTAAQGTRTKWCPFVSFLSSSPTPPSLPLRGVPACGFSFPHRSSSRGRRNLNFLYPNHPAKRHRTPPARHGHPRTKKKPVEAPPADTTIYH